MISIHGLCKRHGDVPVLRGITAEVARGDVVALVGPSGSGKSTLLRCLNALEDFDEGHIEIAGFRLTPAPSARARKEQRRLRAAVGMVFQQFHLFPHLTAAENIALAPRLLRLCSTDAAERKARELLGQLGLDDRAAAYPHQLSGGQQQRVAIARALACEPQVMLFDEPTSALDPKLRQEVGQTLRQVAERGITLLVVTHEMSLAANLASHVWMLRQGRLVEQGPAAEILTTS